MLKIKLKKQKARPNKFKVMENSIIWGLELEFGDSFKIQILTINKIATL